MRGLLKPREMLLAIDPALVRTKMASRVTIGACLSLLAVTLFSAFVHPVPVAGFGLGIVLTVEGALAVRETAARAQLVTRGIGVATAIVLLTIAAALDDHRLLSDGVFLLVIFAASVGRAYGSRWHAVGMYGFMTYFMAAYFRPTLSEVPWAVVGIIISAVVTQGVRFFIVPDNRLASLRGAVTAVEQRAEAILEALLDLIRAGEVGPEGRLQLRSLSTRLKEAALVAQGLLPVGAEASGNEAVIALRVNLLELQLAAEGVVISAIRALPPLAAVRAALDPETGAHAVAEDTDSEEARQNAEALDWFVRARRDLALHMAALKTLPSGEENVAAVPAPVRLSLRHDAVRTAIQITLASALAMAVGLALSRDRWFWAVLTAFLVFVNTRSRGDTAMRSIQRAIGTVLGILVGLVLALAVGPYPVLAFALAVAAVFLAFFNLPVSYARMTFFISIVLALAYAILGTFTVELMWLRIEETAIGAMAGILVSATVLPLHTRAPLDGAVGAWFGALEHLLARARHEAPQAELMDLSRKLDEAYRALADAARPLGAPWHLVTRAGHIRQTLVLFLAATYWARLFARDRALGAADKAEDLHEMIDALMVRIASLRARGAACFYVMRGHESEPPRITIMTQRQVSASLATLAATLERFYPERDAVERV